MSTETQYVTPGTLAKPGPIGRLVRLAFGLGALWAVVQVILNWSGLLTESIPVGWILLVALAFYVFPYVVNLGWGRSWGRRPQVGIAIVLGVAFAGNLGVSGNVWGPVPGIILGAWLVYTFGHLGISFLLSTVIATPGCEMRALPHLWTLASGRPTAEHHCPGPIDNVDRWEARLRRTGADG
jgi:hypothetical protein